MRVHGKHLAATALMGMAMIGAAVAQGDEGYVASGTACTDVFVTSKNGLRFSPHVDPFAPAFIVRGKTLSTPVANCRLRRSTTRGEVRELQFECVNSISYAPVTVYFRRGNDGSLIRQTSAADDVGSRYERCNK